MPKITSGNVPNLRAGQPQRRGQVSGVSKFVPQELNGGVSTFGNRMVLKRGAAVGGGGGLSVTIVETLPPIPASGARIVFWTSAGAGTGDDQMWMAFAGQTEWTAMQFLTSLSGVPV